MKNSTMDLRKFSRTFLSLFGEAPRIFSAPGRVNLIGEHTDYNDGFVLPLAIDRRAYVGVRARSDRRVRAHSLDFSDVHTLSLDEPGQPRRGNWFDYCEGMARILESDGQLLRGADLLIGSDVPLGAGLSSSAALEIAVGLALLDTAGLPVDARKVALAAQRAEHVFVGTQCGIMDQFIAALGVEGHALLLDCRSLEARHIRLDTAEAAIVVFDSGVKHALASSAYNERRRECEEGVELLRRVLPEITHLRDVVAADLARNESLLSPTLLRRCRHVITENARTQTTADLLEEGDMDGVGELMNLSHESLRDDYEVSCDELEVLVHAARKAGACGARMTGGGFGGCTVNLVARHGLEVAIRDIQDEFARHFGRVCPVFEVVPSPGARQE
jgi:galactokinase